MTIDTSPDIEIAVETALDALEDRDAVAAASTFATNGQVVDPQSPEREHRGQESRRGALEWALTNLVAEPAFTIRRCLGHEETCALAVESRSDRSDGSSVKTTTASVVEIGDGGSPTGGPPSHSHRRNGQREAIHMTPESGETDLTVSEPDEPFTDLGRQPGLSARQPRFGGRHEPIDTDVETSRADRRLGNQLPRQVQVQVHGQGRGVRD